MYKALFQILPYYFDGASFFSKAHWETRISEENE